MNTQNVRLSAYLPPEVQEKTVSPMSVIAASDWNDTVINDGFVDLFNL